MLLEPVIGPVSGDTWSRCEPVRRLWRLVFTPPPPRGPCRPLGRRGSPRTRSGVHLTRTVSSVVSVVRRRVIRSQHSVLGRGDYRASTAAARASMPGERPRVARPAHRQRSIDRLDIGRVGSSAGCRVRRAVGSRVLIRQDRRPPVGANYKLRNRTTPCRPRPAWRARSGIFLLADACDNLVKRVKLDRLLHLGGGARVG